MRTWSKQLEELSCQVAQLKIDKQELQQRNRILEGSLTINTHHEERLHCNEVQAVPRLPTRLPVRPCMHLTGAKRVYDEGTEHVRARWIAGCE